MFRASAKGEWVDRSIPAPRCPVTPSPLQRASSSSPARERAQRPRGDLPAAAAYCASTLSVCLIRFERILMSPRAAAPRGANQCARGSPCPPAAGRLSRTAGHPAMRHDWTSQSRHSARRARIGFHYRAVSAARRLAAPYSSRLVPQAETPQQGKASAIPKTRNQSKRTANRSFFPQATRFACAGLFRSTAAPRLRTANHHFSDGEIARNSQIMRAKAVELRFTRSEIFHRWCEGILLARSRQNAAARASDRRGASRTDANRDVCSIRARLTCEDNQAHQNGFPICVARERRSYLRHTPQCGDGSRLARRQVPLRRAPRP